MLDGRRVARRLDPGRIIAGIGAHVPTLTVADQVVDTIVTVARASGLADGMAVCTHRVHLTHGFDGHIAFSLGTAAPKCEATGVDAAWELLHDIARAIARDGHHRSPEDIGLALGGQRRGARGPALTAAAAAGEHRAGAGGRLVHFPGVERLRGTLGVGEVIDLSSIDEVVALDGDPVARQARVATHDHVRPRWQFGSVVLHVQPLSDRLYEPFEAPLAGALA